MDAVRGTLALDVGGKAYRLNERTATLVVRPRGWHLDERHLLVDGAPASASLVDFGLYFFHNAHALIERGSGPYFYLPKMEGHREARLWNDVFVAAQEALGIPRGTIRATVLIETLPAAFEMEEILYELREHAAGLNAGRWDYLFSFIKTFRDRADKVLPDRAQLTMTVPFMRAYAERLVQVCHRARRARDRRDGGVHPEPEGSRGERARDRAACGRTRSARAAWGSTAPGWRIPDLVPVAARGVRRACCGDSARPTRRIDASRGGAA